MRLGKNTLGEIFMVRASANIQSMKKVFQKKGKTGRYKTY